MAHHRRAARQPWWPVQVLVLVVAALVLLALCRGASATVVETKLLGVDLGSHSVKTSAYTLTYINPTSTTPETKMVLNDQTNRKSPACIALRYVPEPPPANHSAATPGYILERSFAEPADALLYRFPLQTVCHPGTLLPHSRITEAEEKAAAADLLARPGTGGSLSRFNTVHQLPHPNRTARLVAVPHKPQLMAPSATAAATSADFETYSAEEVLAMLLRHAKKLAERSDETVNRVTPRRRATIARQMTHRKLGEEDDVASQHPVRHGVLAIPSDLTVAERQSLMDAGAISGIRVTRLLHSTTAAVHQFLNLKSNWVNLAILKRHYKDGREIEGRKDGELKKDMGIVGKKNAVYLMVFDMGYQRSEAAVFELSRPTKGLHDVAGVIGTSRGSPGADPRSVQVVVQRMATSSSDSLGGQAFDHCIASYWDTTFLGGTVMRPQSGAPTAEQVKDRLALLRAAEQARERLSVNQAAPVTVERIRLPGSKSSFTTSLNRTTFEKVCAPLVQQAVQLAKDAWAFVDDLYVPLDMRLSTLAKEEVEHLLPRLERLELIGAAARMPVLQHELGSLPSKSSGVCAEHPVIGAQQSLNADESVVLGAVSLAAAQLQSSLRFPNGLLLNEWIPHNIYFQVTPSAVTHEKVAPNATAVVDPEADVVPTALSGEATTLPPPPLTLLFPKRTTAMPTVYTVELPDRENPFVFSLYSPPAGFTDDAEEAAWLSQHIAAGHRLPAGVFARHYHISDLDRMLEAIHVAAWRDSHQNATHRTVFRVLDSSVSVEVALTQDGIPQLYKAYLDVRLERTAFRRGPPQVEGQEAEPLNTEGDASASNATPEEQDERGAEMAVPPSASSDMNDALMAEAHTPWELASRDVLNRSVLLQTEVVDGGVALRLNVTHQHPYSISAETKEPLPGEAIAAATTQVEVALPIGSNMNAAELQRSYERLAALQEAEEEQHRRGQLRNEIEGLLVSVRSSAVWDHVAVFSEHASKGIAAEFAAVWQTTNRDDDSGADWSMRTPTAWRGIVELVSRWLEDDGEHATVHSLKAQLNMAKAAKDRMEAAKAAVLQFAATPHHPETEANEK